MANGFSATAMQTRLRNAKLGAQSSPFVTEGHLKKPEARASLQFVGSMLFAPHGLAESQNSLKPLTVVCCVFL